MLTKIMFDLSNFTVNPLQLFLEVCNYFMFRHEIEIRLNMIIKHLSVLIKHLPVRYLVCIFHLLLFQSPCYWAVVFKPFVFGRLGAY